MLNGSELANILKNAMNGQDNPTDSHSDFSNSLKDYVMGKAKLQGVYSGIIPGTPPVQDPNNGTYEFDVIAFPISASGLQAGATGGFGSWLNAMSAELSKITFGGTSGSVTAGSPTLLTVSASVDMSSKPDNKNDSMEIVGNDLITSVKNGVPTPTTVPATSVAGGVGTITWSLVL